jgi:hypothetical protein
VTPEAVRGDTTTSPKPSKEPSRENNHVDLVHQHYVETFGKTGKAAELREDERRIIRNALAAANDVNELLTCITACEASDFHQKRAADADRKGSKYNSLGVIFKPRPRFNETQRSRIEWWLEMREEQEGGTAPTTPSPYDAKTEVAHV